MTQEYLREQIEYAKTQIEDLQKVLNAYDPTEKGYDGLVTAYNRWCDRLSDLNEQYSNFEKNQQLEEVRFKEAEERKVKDEKDKKFDKTMRVLELSAKVAIPAIAVITSVALAKLSFAEESDLKICNGRIFSFGKDLVKLIKY